MQQTKTHFSDVLQLLFLLFRGEAKQTAVAQAIGIPLFQRATLTLREGYGRAVATRDIAIGTTFKSISAMWTNLSHILYGATPGSSSTTPSDEDQAGG